MQEELPNFSMEYLAQVSSVFLHHSEKKPFISRRHKFFTSTEQHRRVSFSYVTSNSCELHSADGIIYVSQLKIQTVWAYLSLIKADLLSAGWQNSQNLCPSLPAYKLGFNNTVLLHTLRTCELACAMWKEINDKSLHKTKCCYSECVQW